MFSRPVASIHVSDCILISLGNILPVSYLAIGIIGATVMPHSLFLGSALATQDRIGCRPVEDDKVIVSAANSIASADESLIPASRSKEFLSTLRESTFKLFQAPPKSPHATLAKQHSEHNNNPLPFVKAHIYHGIADVVFCLLGFAVLINSMYVFNFGEMNELQST
jgi:metal iron transporter